MGSFDGVHGGHRVLLERVKQRAHSIGGESVVLTFHPHPRYVLGTADGMKLLSTLDEKIWLLEQMGIDNMIVIPFTTEFSRTSPEDFLQQSIAPLGIKWLIVGYNHRFGYRKQGDYSFLEGREDSLNIEMVEQQQISASKVSSTVIRGVVGAGEMSMAKQLLSHSYIILCHTDDCGNIKPIDENKLLPPAGVYEVMVEDKVGKLRIAGNQELELIFDNHSDKFNYSEQIIIQIK